MHPPPLQHQPHICHHAPQFIGESTIMRRSMRSNSQLATVLLKPLRWCLIEEGLRYLCVPFLVPLPQPSVYSRSGLCRSSCGMLGRVSRPGTCGCTLPRWHGDRGREWQQTDRQRRGERKMLSLSLSLTRRLSLSPTSFLFFSSALPCWHCR